MEGNNTLATIPLSLWEKKKSFLLKIVKTRRSPPESMRKTKIARIRVKKKGREE
jgi:hypothetical protein